MAKNGKKWLKLGVKFWAQISICVKKITLRNSASITFCPVLSRTSMTIKNGQVSRIHRLLAEPAVCARLGQCIEAVGKQVDTINLDRLVLPYSPLFVFG